MAKKRNHRRTETERALHEKAVALRKMTDEQLASAFDERYAKGRQDGHILGYDRGWADGKKVSLFALVPDLIVRLEGAKGIGPFTMRKIRDALRDVGRDEEG